MKNNYSYSRLVIFVSVFTLSIATSANAALVPRLGGQAVYDTDLNITWLADANYAMTSGYDSDGLMTWAEANTWANNLVFGGYDHWRLPTTPQFDSGCDLSGSMGNYNYDFGFNCRSSEMGHLFYDELSGRVPGPGIFPSPIIYSGDPDLGLFTNLQIYYPYWTSPLLVYDQAFYFNLNGGFQDKFSTSRGQFAWAVHDGDIALVPIPSTLWLFGSGLLGLISIANRRKQ